ncbi:iron-sulfur cluster assembly accessory protein [Parahaliea sp. F7430]|uniref:Iron-sulfur cluster assembly accessory protein n=1 Tax=Sediminihaliea albiluteola TaxID=2758564 RepID=A0A7W2TWR4_9GAMM|nr:iron-sulfur cluster assembly accessory protein [Sediminihaliea albiluteola]MBA6413382.1 iron-sulfur cluster assembly accessory protein [Sediminihaliea albiluteola]
MSVETFDVNRDAVVVSDAAATYLKKQLELRGRKAVRLSVKENGCTGFSYVMDEVEHSEENDLTVTLANGLELYIDKASLPVLQGTEIAYEKEGINRTIKFHNPNVTDACGCGESFSIN